jgi:hypothetical protein
MQVIDMPFCWERGWIEFDRDVPDEYIVDEGHFRVLGIIPGMVFVYHAPNGEELYFQFSEEVEDGFC